MGEEVGKISRVEKGQVTIQLAGGEQCNVCAAKSMCAFNEPGSQYRYLNLPYQPRLKEGSQVRLEYRESSRILAAFIVFVVPILFILAGYVLADRYFNFVNRGLVGAVAGLILSGGVLFLLNRWLSRSRFFLPRIIKK